MEDIIVVEKLINVTHLQLFVDARKSYRYLAMLSPFIGKNIIATSRFKDSFQTLNLLHVELFKSIEICDAEIESPRTLAHLQKWIDLKEVLLEIELKNSLHNGIIPNTSDVFKIEFGLKLVTDSEKSLNEKRLELKKKRLKDFSSDFNKVVWK